LLIDRDHPTTDLVTKHDLIALIERVDQLE